MSSSFTIGANIRREKTILGLGGTIEAEEYARIVEKGTGRVIYSQKLDDWNWMSKRQRHAYKIRIERDARKKGYLDSHDPSSYQTEIVIDPAYTSQEVFQRAKESLKRDNKKNSRVHLFERPVYFRDIKFKPEKSNVPGIDSSNMRLEYSGVVAQAAFEEIMNGRAVGIFSGTDTKDQFVRVMSFMIHGLPFPLVDTGSKRIIKHPATDATMNVSDMLAVLDYDFNLACAVLDRKVMGHTMLKMQRAKGYVFEPNGMLIASANGDIDFSKGDKRAQAAILRQRELVRSNFSHPEIYPGAKYAEQAHMRFNFDPAEIDGWMKRKIPVNRAVIVSYPDGNVPEDVVPAIRRFTKDGGLIVIAPPEGNLITGSYVCGVDALNAGAMPSYGMDWRTAWAKLCWVSGQSDDRKEAMKLMQYNFVGELMTEDIMTDFDEAYDILRRRKVERDDRDHTLRTDPLRELETVAAGINA